MDELEGYIKRLEEKVDRQRRELANQKGKRQRLVDAELTRLRTIEKEYNRLKSMVDSQKKDIASLVEDNDRLRGITGPTKRPGKWQLDRAVNWVPQQVTVKKPVKCSDCLHLRVGHFSIPYCYHPNGLMIHTDPSVGVPHWCPLWVTEEPPV